MTYSFTQVDYNMGVATMTSTGDKLYFNPGYIPWWIRAASLSVITLETTTATVNNFTTQLSSKSNTNISVGNIAVIKDPKKAVGTVIYKDAISDTAIKPGQDIVLSCSTAGSTAVYFANLFMEPNYEVPANNSSMIVTT